MTFEACLEEEQAALMSPQQFSLCSARLEQIAGVLRVMEYQELALLVDEMLGLLKDSANAAMQAEPARLVESRQLVFVAATDFPAILEGVLSGQIQHWYEYNQLFNRIRKARNMSLVFSSQTLLTKPHIPFKDRFATHPQQMTRLLDQHVAHYNEAKTQILQNRDIRQGINAFQNIFTNLEVMGRDFRLSTLWGLCATLAESLSEEQMRHEHPVLKLLCSFSTVMQRVRDNGARALNQNIPEDILEKVLDALTMPLHETSRLLAVKCWFNLDLELARAQRLKQQDLLVSFSRKDAFTKTIRLLTERISQLSERINGEIAGTDFSPGQIEDCIQALESIQASIRVLGIMSPVELIEQCLACAPRQAKVSDSLSRQSIVDFLNQCAQILYQCELSLLSHAEELERAVFVSRAGKDAGMAFTGVKLSVVLEAIKNLEQVVIAINNYVDADYDGSKLSDAIRQLEGARVALMAVPLEKAVAYCAGAREFVEHLLPHQGLAVRERGADASFHAFAHLIINTILYLEQVSIGRAEKFERIVQESDKLLESVQSALANEPERQAAAMAEAGNVTAGFSEEGPEQDSSDDTGPVSQPEPDTTVLEGDEDIQAIFIEEAEEILPQIHDSHDLLCQNLHDAEALADLRRSYHTLKGSGRMVGAEALAALAWSVENLLNHVIGGAVVLDNTVLGALRQVQEKLPFLVDGFRNNEHAAVVADSVAAEVAWMDSFVTANSVAEAPTGVLAETAGTAREKPALYIVTKQQDTAIDTPVHESGDLERAAAEDDVASESASKADGESLSEVFAIETQRQIGRIRQYLDDDLAADAEEQAITTSSYLIPVHTLYGNCTVAELQQFGHVVGQLERLLQDHPYRKVNNSLKILLSEFCEISARVTHDITGTTAVALTDALRQELDEFLSSLARVRDELSGHEPPDAYAVEIDAIVSTMSTDADSDNHYADADDSLETTDYDALLLSGFLRESRAINALIGNLYQAFRVEHQHDRAQQLQDQFAHFEGAASLAEQAAIASVCHALSILYKQYAEGLFSINDTLITLLDQLHAWVNAGMQMLEDGAAAPAPVPDHLLMQLKQSIGQQIAVRTTEKVMMAEEQVEESLLAVFVEEAAEILHELDSRMADWQQAPDDRGVLDDLLRSLHTLKGSAALVGEQELSEAAHRFETLIIEAGHGGRHLDEHFFAVADRHLNILQVLFALYRSDENGCLRRMPISDDELTKLLQVDEVEVSIGAAGSHDGISVLSPVPQVQAASLDMPETDVARSNTGVALDEHVRVSGNLLKDLLNDTDEISIARNRIEQNMTDFNVLMADMDETLGRLQDYIHSFEMHTKTGTGISQRAVGDGLVPAGGYDRNQGSDFDALEMDKYTELQQIALSLLEDYDDLRDIRKNLSGKIRNVGTMLNEQQRSTHKLQDGLISSQMVPFAGIVPRLRRLARQVGTELNKQLTIKFSNPEGKIDRSILQAVVSPIEHMIRNAIDHGIESTEDRAALQKPLQAELLVKLYRQGANIILDISDDGRGIDTRKIRQKAIADGILDPDATVSDQELCQLILRAGFSTSDTISRISGRGVGLDVVRKEIKQIGGDIEIHSRPGLGTTFRIRLPLTSSLNRALLFRVAGIEYVMLLNTIDGIILEKTATLQNCYKEQKTSVFQYAGKSYELAYLGALLGDRATPDFQHGMEVSSSLLLVSGTHRNVALHVDAIMGSRELVVKSLGKQFANISALAGGVILGDGRVVLVLDPHSLVDSNANKDSALFQTVLSGQSVAADTEGGKTVLVVDDSITVRKVTSAILKRNGMKVILAKNGLEAVEILQNTLPDIMLLDIEMPKMDGFEVAAHIRQQDSDVRNLPIIMITSRIGEKHRSRAEKIGVNQYMCKPFQEENLLEVIAGYN
ncbi:MAG: Hpt domain-containing protein [Pseudomonadales bacterium]|nr:Hpt domain-containing protein [Pseudomonadales bacterium]